MSDRSPDLAYGDINTSSVSESRDRLFAFFGAAFWLLSLSWALLALISQTDDTRPYVYSIRLVAFALIIFAIIDKNRART